MVGQITDLSNNQQQILRALYECDDELSGQQVHRTLLDRSILMGLTTVYRNLRELQQKGLIRCRNLPNGETRYAPVERDHHHLTCVDCGHTEILKSCPLKNIDLPKSQANQFNFLFHTLEFFGICEKCSQR